MEPATNASSEEELLQLREEGKISEAEYVELRNVMYKPSPKGTKADVPGDVKGSSKQKMGKISFCLMLAGIVVPIVSFFICFSITNSGEGDVIFDVCFFLCLLIEIPAFVFGVISLPDIFGKATVTTISVISAFAVLLISLSYFSSIRSEHAKRDMAMAELQDVRQAQRMREQAISNQTTITKLKAFPLDDMQGLITQSEIRIDKETSYDNNGSLRIDVTKSTTIRLFETGDIDIENAKLFYQAKLRTENVLGEVYLEMWCHFHSKGEFFSKGLTHSLTGTTGWTTVETPFVLKKGENPDNVKLNLVINGKGTVWIDDIRLLKGTLI